MRLPSPRTILCILVAALLLTTTLSLRALRRERLNTERLVENIGWLHGRLSDADSLLLSQHASTVRLRLRVGELQELRAADSRHISQLGIRLRRVESLATTHTLTTIDTLVALPDGPSPRTTDSITESPTPECPDSITALSSSHARHAPLLSELTHATELHSATNPYAKPTTNPTTAATINPTTSPTIAWDDGWVSARIRLLPEGVECHILSRDTLRQVVHRVPHRWWIFRWGTRAIRQEISCSNPHTQIVYSEYIELER